MCWCCIAGAPLLDITFSVACSMQCVMHNLAAEDEEFSAQEQIRSLKHHVELAEQHVMTCMHHLATDDTFNVQGHSRGLKHHIELAEQHIITNSPEKVTE